MVDFDFLWVGSHLSNSCLNVMVFRFSCFVCWVRFGRYCSASFFVRKPDFETVTRWDFPCSSISRRRTFTAIQVPFGSLYTEPVPFPLDFGRRWISCFAPQAGQNFALSGSGSRHFLQFGIFPLPFRGKSGIIKAQNAPIVVGGC